MRKAIERTSSLLAVAVAACACPVLAQELPLNDTGPAISDGEIVVTAQRRQERSVDVPISITTLGGEQLATANVDELSDIARVSPGVRFDFSSGFFQPTIRGVGTSNVTSGGGSNVGIYIDGFYSPNPLAADFDLLSVESIQVLKGPQGTLFGRNTTGGAILVQTADPDEETAIEMRGSYGRFDELKAQAYATFALAEGVAIDIQGLYKSGDGWQRDITSGKRVGAYQNTSVRAGLLLTPADGLSVLLRYQHNDVDDPTPLLPASWFDRDFGPGQPSFAAPGQFTYDQNRIATGSVQEFFRSKSDIYQGTIRADLGFANLTSYTQYRQEDVNTSVDLDYSGVDLLQMGIPVKNRTVSQELLLTSKPGPRLQWTAGLFYFSNKDRYITTIDAAGNTPEARLRLGGSSTTTKSYAAFLDMTYELSPKFFVTAGARYARDKVVDAYWNARFSAVETPVPNISDDRVTPRLVLRYKPDQNMSLYASYTKGYKAAIIDVGGSCQNAPFICNDVRPETIDAFEVGAKYSGAGLSAELAGFYYDYKNLQVSLYRAGTAEVVNAAQSEIYGLDGQVQYRVTDRLDLQLGAAWTHARYKEFANAPIYTPCVTQSAAVQATCLASGISFIIVGQDLSNVPMQRTPEFTGNIGARYTVDLAGGELNLSGNLYHSSEVFFGPSGTQFRQGNYQTLALRAAWTDPADRFTVALWGENVTDSRFRVGAQYTNYGIGANWNKPATYGVEIRARL
ncbi:TonB-dependent receptor [Novosphingobium sp. M1R2S20]|uniref:TonB-dependent receptor n=1 Tax=Novosphingobium rhizovicinum TaxID=3228928 RepID=A0ABV3RE48_9SPHN